MKLAYIRLLQMAKIVVILNEAKRSEVLRQAQDRSKDGERSRTKSYEILRRKKRSSE